MISYTTTDTMSELSDESVFERTGSEPWLFTALIERYQSAFLTEACSIAHDEHEAEKIVQDAFSRIYMSARLDYEIQGESYAPWAFAVLRNTAWTHFNRTLTERQSL